MYLVFLLKCIIASSYEPGKITRIFPNDPIDYDDCVLLNGTQVIVAEHRMFKQSSLYLAVGAGKYNEPAETQGVADLLRRIIEQSIKNYVGTISFANELSQGCYNRGECTSKTELRNTHYRIVVPDSRYFAESVEILMRVIANPTLTTETVMEGMRMMDAEYNHKKVNYMSRLDYILTDCMKDECYKYAIETGNAETLRNDSQIVENVRKFWGRYYIGTNMCLVMCSDLSMDAMAAIAAKFNMIRKKTNAAITIPSIRPLHPDNGKYFSIGHFINGISNSDPTIYKMEHRGHLYRTAALGNQNIMTINTSLPKGPFLKSYPIVLLKAMFDKLIKKYLYPEMLIRARGTFPGCIVADQYDTLRITISIPLAQSGSTNHSMILGQVKTIFRRMSQGFKPALLPRVDRVKARFEMMLERYLCFNPRNLSTYLARAAFEHPIENLLNHEVSFESVNPEMLLPILKFLSNEANWVVVLFDTKYTQCQPGCYRIKQSDMCYTKEELEMPGEAVVFLPEESIFRQHRIGKAGIYSILRVLNLNMRESGITLLNATRSGETAVPHIYVFIVRVQRKSATISSILVDVAYLTLRAYELSHHINARKTSLIKKHYDKFIKVELCKKTSKAGMVNAARIFACAFLNPVRAVFELAKANQFVRTQASSFFERAQKLGISCVDGPGNGMSALYQNIFSTINLTSELVVPARIDVKSLVYQKEGDLPVVLDCRKLVVPEEIKCMLPSRHPRRNNWAILMPLSKEVSYVHLALRIRKSFTMLGGKHNAATRQPTNHGVYDMLVANVILALSLPIFLQKVNLPDVYVCGRNAIVTASEGYSSIHYMATSTCEVAHLESRISGFIMQLPQYLAAIPPGTYNDKLHEYFTDDVRIYELNQDKKSQLPASVYLRSRCFYRQNVLSILTQKNLVKYCESLSSNCKGVVIPSSVCFSEYTGQS